MRVAVVIPTWNWDKAEVLAQDLRDGGPVDIFIAGTRLREEFSPALHYGAIHQMAHGVRQLPRIVAEYNWIVFLHDDVILHESTICWTQQLHDLTTTETGLVGFGGAAGLGHRDLYKYPMNDINRLARSGYVSNTRDAEAHGRRSTTPVYNLATLDGFALAIRGSLYPQASWDMCLKDGFLFHGYDHWLALRVRELGYGVTMLPVDCTHKGGGTEVAMGEQYKEWCRSKGYTPEELHRKSHELLYNRFRNLLPIIGGGHE